MNKGKIFKMAAFLLIPAGCLYLSCFLFSWGQPLDYSEIFYIALTFVAIQVIFLIYCFEAIGLITFLEILVGIGYGIYHSTFQELLIFFVFFFGIIFCTLPEDLLDDEKKDKENKREL